MKKKISKFQFVSFLSCLAVLVLSFSPCSCLAESPSPLSDTKEKAHSCCDDKSSNSNEGRSGCDNCQNCVMGSSCSVDLGEAKVAHKIATPELPYHLESLAFFSAPTLLEAKPRYLFATSPPEFLVTSSSSLSCILGRWLI